MEAKGAQVIAQRSKDIKKARTDDEQNATKVLGFTDSENVNFFYNALDVLNTNVFCANNEFVITFANKKAIETMQGISKEIKDAFDLDVKDLVGTCIDTFHGKRIKDIRGMLNDPKNFPIRSDINFAGLTLSLNISRINSDNGNGGFILNWEEVSEQRKTESEMIRVKNMLENAPINVMMADKNFKLVYINPKSIETLKGIEQYLPKPVDQLLGESIDIFHKNPSHQRGIVGDPKNLPRQAQIHVGPEILDLLVSPIYDKSGAYVGPMVTWDIITEKLKNANDMVRMRNMVENAPINIMMADLDYKLVYINPKSRETLKSIQNLLPIPVDEIEGKSIDIFHKNPAHQRKILADPKNLPHRAKIKLGEETLDLLVSAMYDKQGTYLGAMVTWEVISQKVSLVETLSNTSNDLSSASEELLAVAKDITKNAQTTSEQATTASAASEEVSTGVQTMSSSMEEMATAIREITKSTNESSSMSNEAMSLAKSTNEIIGKLGDSSLDIGNVVKVISSIAQQTNLLALNATIEAARAGDAGKGFAVVANEVKELAKETGKATSDITKKIETIQGDSKEAVSAIDKINKAIEKLNNIASTIAASVEEQAATTNDVSRVVQESATAVKGISENVSEVNKVAKLTGEGCNQTEDSARGLSKLAEELKDLVKKIEV